MWLTIRYEVPGAIVNHAEMIEAVAFSYPVDHAKLIFPVDDPRQVQQRIGMGYRATWRGKAIEGRSDHADPDEARKNFEAALTEAISK